MDQRVCAILLAGGSGSRMNSEVTKQRIRIDGETVLFRAVNAFSRCNEITDIIVVVKDGELDFATEEIGAVPKVRKIVIGGKNRVESAENGFNAIDFSTNFVAIHDVARCLITPDMITKVVIDAKKFGAASASAAVVDTVKIVDENGFVVNTIDRDTVRLATTPQIFRYDLYEKALRDKSIDKTDVTDDNMIMERIGVKVYMTDIGKRNIKIMKSI